MRNSHNQSQGQTRIFEDWRVQFFTDYNLYKLTQWLIGIPETIIILVSDKIDNRNHSILLTVQWMVDQNQYVMTLVNDNSICSVGWIAISELIKIFWQVDYKSPRKKISYHKLALRPECNVMWRFHIQFWDFILSPAVSWYHFQVNIQHYSTSRDQGVEAGPWVLQVW